MDHHPHEQAYQADAQLLYLIIDLAQRLKRLCYLCDFVLLAYTYLLYNTYINDLVYFACGEVPMILLLGFIQYRMVAAKGAFISKIVTEVVITTNVVTLKTAAFNGPLWFKKDPGELTLEKAEMLIAEIANPYPEVFKTNIPVTKLSYGDKEAYIITQYFNREVAEELKQS